MGGAALVDLLLVGMLADVGGNGIVNGEVVPTAHPEIVALAGADPESGEGWVFCSGSQIDFDHVLTAAHCIDEGQAIIDEYELDMVVLWGGDLPAAGPTEVRAVAASEVAPGWPDDPLSDLAIVTLSEPVHGVPWRVLNDEPLDDALIGVEAEFFGFGVTAELAEDAGTKRSTTAPIVAVSPWDFEAYAADTNLCYGDSGGPSLVGGEQIGVNVGVWPSCIGGRSQSARVDVHADWILDVAPDAAFDPEDVPDVEDPGRSWLDLGVTTSLDALRGRSGAAQSGGCSSVPRRALPSLLDLVRRRS